jgi:tetratricopeptide (TPR) repeat protein
MLTRLLLLIALGLTCVLPADGRSQSESDAEAKKHFQRALRLDALNDIGAEQEYKAAIGARGGNYPEASLELSFYLRRRGRFSESSQSLQAYITQTPQVDHQNDLEELADLRKAAGMKQRIDNSQRPEARDLMDFAVFVARYQGVRDAVPYAQKSVDLYPNSSEAHVLLARLLTGSGQQERRYSLLRRAIELDPKSANAHHELGWYYIGAFRGSEAADEFRKSLDLSDGKLGDAWQGLGWALSNQGLRREAIKLFGSTCVRRVCLSSTESELNNK